MGRIRSVEAAGRPQRPRSSARVAARRSGSVWVRPLGRAMSVSQNADGDGGLPAERHGRRPGPPAPAEERQWWALQAADAERRRIAADLHDGAQQRLLALRIGITLATELIADDPEAAVARFERL